MMSAIPILNSILGFLLLVGLLMFSGCATQATFTPLGNAAPTAPMGKSPDEVQLFLAERPQRSFRELGLLTFNAGRGWTSEAEAFQAFRSKAAEIGADAVILLDARTEIETNYRGFYRESDVDSFTVYRGSAIVFTDDG